MKDIVAQLKSMMELQHQNVMSTPVNYQPQQFVPFVGQGQPFCISPKQYFGKQTLVKKKGGYVMANEAKTQNFHPV